MNTGTWFDRTFRGDARHKGKSPRALSDKDIDSFFKEQRKPPAPMTLNRLRTHMSRKNYARWRRLKKDFAWMQREMRKLGLNPEDARWLP